VRQRARPLKAGDKIRVAGIDVTLVSEAEAELSPICICVEWTDPPVLADNVRAACAFCHRPIQHRPSVPRKPPKVCIGCGTEWATATHH
jgi:hypothetical protein